MPGYGTHTLSLSLSLAASVSCCHSAKRNRAWLGMYVCMFVCLSVYGREEEVEKSKNDLEKRKREISSKSVSICICLGVFVCVAVSAVVLQVQSRCLSFFCSSPASINRSLCALQFLRGLVLFSLFFPPLLLLHSSSSSCDSVRLSLYLSNSNIRMQHHYLRIM